MQTEQETLLAEVLSPSQVALFLNCPAKWMFRYLLDLKDPGTAATALGKAFHETIARNFRQKQQTTCDLPVAECLDFFGSVLGRELEEVKRNSSRGGGVFQHHGEPLGHLRENVGGDALGRGGASACFRWG